jgi:hypothetical protein
MVVAAFRSNSVSEIAVFRTRRFGQNICDRDRFLTRGSCNGPYAGSYSQAPAFAKRALLSGGPR